MDVSLKLIVGAGLASAQLPASLNIWDLRDGFEQLRQSMVSQQVEWGSCIHCVEDRLALGHPTGGCADSVAPLCEPEHHNRYVGFAHVHLPDSTSGLPFFGFSELDYRAALADGAIVSLVCNGPQVFAMVRTLDRSVPRQIVPEHEFAQWQALYQAAFDEARQDKALDRHLWLANREICRRLGLAFYCGLFGQPLSILYRPI